MTIVCVICVASALAFLLEGDPWSRASEKALLDGELLSNLSDQPDRIGWRLSEDLSLSRAMLWDTEAKLRYPVPDGFTPIPYEFSEHETRRLTAIQSRVKGQTWEQFDMSGGQLLHCQATPAICLVYDRLALEGMIGLEAGALTSPDRGDVFPIFLLILAALCAGYALWSTQGKPLASNALSLMPDRYSATRGALEVRLTARDLKLLSLLKERNGAVVTKDELYDAGWGRDYMPNSRALDQHMINLRHKLDPDKSRPVLIETIHGVGYRLIN